MNIFGGTIGGIIGGLVGAAIWAGVSYFTGYEIGWIAWGVGGLVGLGCVLVGKAGGTQMGVAAVVITILSLLGGKFAAVELAIGKEIGSKDEVIQNAVADLQNDEMVVSYIADEIVEARTAAGEEIEWPSGAGQTETVGESDYPPAIWAEAQSRWEQMSAQDREIRREQLVAQVSQNIDEWYTEIAGLGFQGSFSLMDLIFFGLAVVTAFQIASRGPKVSPEVESFRDQTA